MQKESPTILKQARGIKTREGWEKALAADDTQVEALTLTIPNPRLAKFPVLAIFLNSFGYTLRKISLPYWQQLP